MWQQDSIFFLEDGRREVAIIPTLHAQFVKATPTELQYYFSHNLETLSLLKSNKVRYLQPNKLEIWHPGKTGGPPSV